MAFPQLLLLSEFSFAIFSFSSKYRYLKIRTLQKRALGLQHKISESAFRARRMETNETKLGRIQISYQYIFVHRTKMY